MKASLITFCLLVQTLLFSSSFSEPYTGLSLEIPDSFQPLEVSSWVSSCPYWYTFVDSKGNLLTIEIEEYDSEQTLPTHFHNRMMETDLLMEESMFFEGLEFCNFTVGETEFTKLKVRILATTETEMIALFFCDYLFVHDHFGITVSLIQREENSESAQEAEVLMDQVLHSISF